MSQKKLQIVGIANELEGASLYFNPPSKPIPLKPISESSKIGPKIPAQLSSLKVPMEDDRLPKHTSMHARKQERTHANPDAQMNGSMHARMQPNQPVVSINNEGGEQPSTHKCMHAGEQYDFIETIRKSVKKVGREELYVRLTPEEKNEIRSVVYQINQLYRGKGGKTSENELSRIALKFLLEDYKKNGEQSILSITQEALNA